jgi:precorrin-6B methylase 1
MARVGEAFRRLATSPVRRTYTVVVTTDPFFASWARVIDLNHSNREHHPAPTLAAAAALVERLEARPTGSRPADGTH